MGDVFDRSSPEAGRLGELFLQIAKELKESDRVRYAPFGLTPAQGQLLGVLARSRRSLHMAELARELGVVPRAVTPQVDVLEAAGLVRRRTDPDNRRATLLDLTPEGAEMRERLFAERIAGAEDRFGVLDPPQRETLLELLEIVAGAAPQGRKEIG